LKKKWKAQRTAPQSDVHDNERKKRSAVCGGAAAETGWGKKKTGIVSILWKGLGRTYNGMRRLGSVQGGKLYESFTAVCKGENTVKN